MCREEVPTVIDNCFFFTDLKPGRSEPKSSVSVKWRQYMCVSRTEAISLVSYGSETIPVCLFLSQQTHESLYCIEANKYCHEIWGHEIWNVLSRDKFGVTSLLIKVLLLLSYCLSFLFTKVLHLFSTPILFTKVIQSLPSTPPIF
ncbi:hypothetical protein F2Q70_00027362 [Brassica cretica]|uniref:Uncharacterized protein n=1 Tax=Brassica cretica TaxID=69181 RepID=A0A8S9L4W0_BRACR|nr:hypothetical protein F2Q70_00027362 [Brassica cretica]